MLRISLFLRDKADKKIIEFIQKAGESERSEFIRNLLLDGIKYRNNPHQSSGIKVIIL